MALNGALFLLVCVAARAAASGGDGEPPNLLLLLACLISLVSTARSNYRPIVLDALRILLVVSTNRPIVLAFVNDNMSTSFYVHCCLIVCTTVRRWSVTFSRNASVDLLIRASAFLRVLG